MQTDFPTTTIYFVFAFTHCGVDVYKPEEAMLRKLLSLNAEVEILDKKPKNFDTVDSRILTAIISGSLKALMEKIAPNIEIANMAIQELQSIASTTRSS